MKKRALNREREPLGGFPRQIRGYGFWSGRVFPGQRVDRGGLENRQGATVHSGAGLCQSAGMTGAEWLSMLAPDGYGLGAPATADELASTEKALDATLPPDLRALYLITDGVFDPAGEWFVFWPLADVVDRNLADWLTYRASPTRSDLLAFGDDGTGDPFCVARDGGDAVFYWSPIDDTATCLANTIIDFWTRWQNDTMPPH
ncbi:MAG TPA: SMI1/KNR4 family protein [Vicinamibacterales bacterium]